MKFRPNPFKPSKKFPSVRDTSVGRFYIALYHYAASSQWRVYFSRKEGVLEIQMGYVELTLSW